MNYKVNKQKCTGCRVCLRACPGATEIEDDDKARVVNQGKLEQCGGESVCPFGAIERVSEKGEKPGPENPPSPPPYGPFPGSPPYGPPPSGGRGLGRGRGPSWSRGMGRKFRGGRG